MLLRRSLHSLHLLRTRLWAHMPSPPQSLQSLLTRLCWQMLAPPQSLHWLLMRLCWQMLVPPQSLHSLLMQLCWQMLAPPQSLHSRFRLLCSHFFSALVGGLALPLISRSATAACSPACRCRFLSPNSAFFSDRAA